MRVALFVVTLALAGGSVAAFLPVPPVSQWHCADAGDVTVTKVLSWDSQLENLAFDDAGHLVVVGLHGDQLILVDGEETVLHVVDMPASHGVVFRPEDGRFYAAGRLAGSPSEATGLTDVLSFRIEGDRLVDFSTYATGIRTVNGMAFGPDGALYVSDPLAQSPPYTVRIEPSGADHAPWRPDYGINGLWTAGDGMYAAVTGDQASPILFMPFDRAAPVQVVAETSFGSITLQPAAHAPAGQAAILPNGLDDLTIAPDGFLYATAHVSGELIRVDPSNGHACVVADGFLEPTSVRVAPAGFGEHGGSLYVTDMGGIGVTALFGPGAGGLYRLDLA